MQNGPPRKMKLKFMGLPQCESHKLPLGEAAMMPACLSYSASSDPAWNLAGSTLFLGARIVLRRSTTANVKQFTARLGGLR